MINRKRIVNARMFVALPFRTTEERDKFLHAVEAHPDKTIGEFVLEIIREHLDRQIPANFMDIKPSHN